MSKTETKPRFIYIVTYIDPTLGWSGLEARLDKMEATKEDYPWRFAITDTYDEGGRKVMDRSMKLLCIAVSEEAIDEAHEVLSDAYGFLDLHRVVDNEWGSTRFASRSDY
jgi:hypothetical protein|tara:strand:+ start:418 stop:747 length:330 start_codon:yes stop_codon:yes gene_type:complete